MLLATLRNGGLYSTLFSFGFVEYTTVVRKKYEAEVRSKLCD